MTRPRGQQPWRLRRLRPAGFILALTAALTLASCFSFEAMNWGEWSDPAATMTAPAARFGWARWPGMITSIDGHGDVATGFKRARLRPGPHTVAYSGHIHDFGQVAGEIRLDLAADHDYEFNFATCYWCMPRRFAVWVQDRTSGEVVWGKPRDWPSWYL